MRIHLLAGLTTMLFILLPFHAMAQESDKTAITNTNEPAQSENIAKATQAAKTVPTIQPQRPYIVKYVTKRNNVPLKIETKQCASLNAPVDYQIDMDADGKYEYTHVTGDFEFVIAEAGHHKIAFSGEIPCLHIRDIEVVDVDKAKKNPRAKPPAVAIGYLKSVEQWGDISWLSMSNMFAFNRHLTDFPAKEAPDLTKTISMKEMFHVAVRFNQPIDHWNVSNVKDMSDMFLQAESFNQPLNSWNVSNVTDMSSMFVYADKFNKPLTNWDVTGKHFCAGPAMNKANYPKGFTKF